MGTWMSSTSRVIAIANTPSEKASRRFGLTLRDSPARVALVSAPPAGRSRRGRRQAVRELRRPRAPGPDRRARRGLWIPMRGGRDRREAGKRSLGRLPERRPDEGRGEGGGFMGPRGRRGGRGGGAPYEHGP